MKKDIEEIFVEGVMAEEVDIGEIKEQDMKPVLLEDLGMEYPMENSKRKYRYGIFECPYCGKEFRATYGDIKKGTTRSCGCLYSKDKITHGLSRSRFYNTWRHMVARCHKTEHKQYVDYGARGIIVCEDWRDIKKFIKWAEETHIEGYSLDRIDNDKGYSPDNCRWADGVTQATNQRKKSNNTSGFIGVHRYKEYNKWISRITFKGVRISLGYYDSIEEAVKARDNYIKEHNLPHKLSTDY